MSLQISSVEKQALDFSVSDEITKKVSKQISELAIGLTPKQFFEAVEFALYELNNATVLSIQPVGQIT